MSDTLIAYLAIGFIIVITVMFALGLRRGKNVQATNEKIEANQKRQIVLHERQVTALEQIADSLKRRG